MTARQTLDLGAPLPRRATIVEASAGTGKTYAIVGLLARYVAEGTPLSDLLVVTFTRAATSELRHRVRARLEETLRVVEQVPDGPQRPILPDDDVVAAILNRSGLEPSEAADNLRTALSDVDGAAITTIHSFCQQALDGLGLAVGLDREAELLEQDHELVAGVVDDLLVRRYVGHTGDLLVSRWQAMAIGRTSVNQPHAAILPEGDADATTMERRWLARAVRGELARRKAAGRWMSYDDLLTRLRDAVRHPVHGGEVIRGLQVRYPVVLVDEFQDTDPVQWDILRLAFSGGPLTLVGDPKQAIYSFRGADVHAYLDAVRHVGEDRVRTLATNRRSDQRLLDAYNRLLEGATLGGDILYHPVGPGPGRDEPGLLGAKPDVPLRVRLVRSDADGLPESPAVSQLRDLVARDLTGEVTQLLTQGVTIVERSKGGDGDAVAGTPEVSRPVLPRDIAVLVRTNDQAARVQECLLDAGVPAVINGAGSVFETVAASEWLWLLAALDQPHDEGRARAAALTALIGWSATELHDATDVEWQRLHDLLHDWSAHLRATSPAALWRRIRAERRIGPRLLSRVGGERRLTDFDHVADLLHQEATRGGRGTRDLSGWLRAEMAREEQGVAPDERARRLESDADAVQVVTMHRSKGLEFPVVYCPYLWSAGYVDRAGPPVARYGGRRVLHTGTFRDEQCVEEFKEVRETQEREQQDEDLRLLYVALTRAEHQAVVWWADHSGAKYSPLSRLLFCRRGGTGAAMTTCRQGMSPRTDDAVMERLQQTFGDAGELISLEPVAVPTGPVAVSLPAAAQPELDAAHIDPHRVDRTWRRTSYSALTARVHAPGAPEHEAAVTDDEQLTDPAIPSASTGADDPDGLREVALPLGGLPGGTRLGTYVHALFEHLDFTAGDLSEEIARAATAQRGRSPLSEADEAVLHSGLADVLATPLGPIADGRALRSVPRRDRRDEMTFELPLAGGDTATGAVSVRDLGDVLARHADGDPLLTAYVPRLDAPTFVTAVRGFLTGSIDLTLRVRGNHDRFVVVDYKTNQLTPWDATPSAWDYRPEALIDAMCRGHYPLQALLYVVAVHRYLRWRLPGYDADRDLGGVAYLFVRGMLGPHSPRPRTPAFPGTPTGVLPWRPAAALVDEVSALLHRGGTR